MANLRLQITPGRIFLAILMTALAVSRAAEVPAYTSAEKWVLEEVAKGEVADLSKKFGQEKDRKLRASFLERLLTGAINGLKPSRTGIRIQWAVIDERLDLTNAQIPCEVWLDKCQFHSDVIFNRATFAGAVTFDKSTFKGAAAFGGARIAAHAAFREALFEGPVSFAGCEVGGDFHLAGAHFANKTEVADFAALTARDFVFLQNAVFEGPVSFVGANIAKNFQLDGAHFANRESPAGFSGLKVGRLASLSKTIFDGPVEFLGADIHDDFIADGAQFRDKKVGASFNSVRIGNLAQFEETVFEGPINFVSAKIAGNFQAAKTQFKDTARGAEFGGIEIGRLAIFSNAVFDGPVIFRYAHIGANFEAFETRFNDLKQGVDFNRIRIGDVAFFKKAIFEGPVDFGAAEITSTFQADGAQFRSATGPVKLMMKCGMTGWFSEATFAGPVLLASSSFVDLALDGKNSEAHPIPELNLASASIKRTFRLSNLVIRNLSAPAFHVEGTAFISDVVVQHSADLTESEFGSLDVSGSIWPKDAKAPGTFLLQGMNYKILRASPNDSLSRRSLLKLINQSSFSVDVYGNLEAFFLRQGQRADADKVFIAGKRREGRESWGRGDYLRWFGGKLLDWLVGYGRHPWHAAIPCALLVGFGCFLFSTDKMQPVKPDEAARVYNPFWYSLGLFLPIVNLQSDGNWKPKNRCRFLRHYVRVHILLGWILIPMVVAALTGLIK
jgi:hypothetical protein